MWAPETQFPRSVRVLPLARIRRERLLPVPGTVHVSFHQEVTAETVIAEAELAGELASVEIGAHVAFDRRRVEKALLVQPGDVVSLDQPLAAGRNGLRRWEVRSPAAGVILAIDDEGRILIQLASRPVQLLAGMYGRVVNVMPRFGAVIEGSGALFQGIWGNGRESFGVLRLLTMGANEPLTAEQFDVALRGTIVVGGATIDREGLEAARDVQVRGLIVGAMPYELVTLARTLAFPVVLTEGFGRVPIAPPIYEGIAACDGREALLDGRYEPRWGRQLPELFVPLNRPAEPVPEPGPLAEGQQVRLLAPPRFGRIGRIVRLAAGTRPTESGLALPGCEVRLEDGEVVFVPYSNLERLG